MVKGESDVSPSASPDDGSKDLEAWAARDVEGLFETRKSVAIQADVRQLDWKLLALYQFTKFGRLFDVIYMDPPWRYNIKLKYPTLTDDEIMALPFGSLQSAGYIFCWIIDVKEEIIKQRFKQLGYECKARLTWLKRTAKGNPVNSSGVTMRKSTEFCYVFAKGKVSDIAKFHKAHSFIDAKVRGHSVKPDEMYQQIKALVPDGHYLEIFGRQHNLQDDFVTVGN